MFGVTINNDDAIIQSLESQVTFEETAQLLSPEIFGLHLPLTFAGNKEALLNKRYTIRTMASNEHQTVPQEMHD